VNQSPPLPPSVSSRGRVSLAPSVTTSIPEPPEFDTEIEVPVTLPRKAGRPPKNSKTPASTASKTEKTTKIQKPVIDDNSTVDSESDSEVPVKPSGAGTIWLSFTSFITFIASFNWFLIVIRQERFGSSAFSGRRMVVAVESERVHRSRARQSRRGQDANGAPACAAAAVARQTPAICSAQGFAFLCHSIWFLHVA
jgi:hypothetical protein